MVVLSVPAMAQMGGALHQRGGSNAGNKSADPAPAAPLKVAPEPWPRLDPGAMLCSSKDALMQYQEAMATASADQPAPIPPGCTRILAPTPISIVQRDGPSRVQVKTTSPPDRAGWTDAWLPDKRP